MTNRDEIDHVRDFGTMAPPANQNVLIRSGHPQRKPGILDQERADLAWTNPRPPPEPQPINVAGLEGLDVIQRLISARFVTRHESIVTVSRRRIPMGVTTTPCTLGLIT